jgi:hypothetical protein
MMHAIDEDGDADIGNDDDNDLGGNDEMGNGHTRI